MIGLNSSYVKFHSNGEKVLCDICGKKNALYKCKICKRNVCENDFYDEIGVCKICAASLCEICKTRLSVTYCQYCGKLVCTEDSIQLDNVRRICIECFKEKKYLVTKVSNEHTQGAVKLAKRIIKL
jgi:hypothetical protein